MFGRHAARGFFRLVYPFVEQSGLVCLISDNAFTNHQRESSAAKRNKDLQALRKLFRLSLAEQLLLTQAAVLLPAVRVALRFTTVARLESIKTAWLPVAARLPAETMARMVQIAADHGIYRARCLEQSLVLRYFLQNRGIDSQILFGTRKEDGRVSAHAWVEVNGVPLNDLTAVRQQFSPLGPP